MSEFDTQTEEAFYNLCRSKEIDCKKIDIKKDGQSYPDFICKKNDYKVVFELKDLNISGSTKYFNNGVIGQNITIAETISRFIKRSKKKFKNKKYINYPSGLIVTNLRPLIRWKTIVDQCESVIKNELNNYPEIGNVILTGYNKPSNRIIAFHIYENKNSKRTIDKEFFKDFNYEFMNI